MQWNVNVCNDVQQSWNKWKKLNHIEQLHVQKCFKPIDFGQISSTSLLNLVMSNTATSGWLARETKFIAICFLESQELYQRSLPLFPGWSYDQLHNISRQVKGCAIITYKQDIYELPHE